jgi:S1-C subfamily serine protease
MRSFFYYMKNYILLSFWFFYCAISYAQSNSVESLNGYKSIYVAPLKSSNGEVDVMGIRQIVCNKIKAAGVQLSESFNTSQMNENAYLLVCRIEQSNNKNKAENDYVKIVFTNCLNQTVYSVFGEMPMWVGSYKEGWRTATHKAMKPFENYHYIFDENKSISAALPKLEMTSINEDSIKKYLSSNSIDRIEGIYKSFKTEGFANNYKIAILKTGDLFKAYILDSDLAFWKIGELKAVFEHTAIPDVYSANWFLAYKTKYETFAYIENTGILKIDFVDSKTGESKDNRFIKMYPNKVGFKNEKQESFKVEKSSGSGFFMSVDGLIATNAHVVEDANRIDVSISTDSGSVTLNAIKLLIDEKNDVAILKIQDNKFHKLNNLPYSIVENVDIGSKVFTIGFPLNDVMGNNYKVSDGIISSSSGVQDDIRYYQVSVPLQPGNSGGPLFNKDGNVIGITSARLNEKAVGTQIENVNYALKSSYLLNIYNMVPNSKMNYSNNTLSTADFQNQIKVLKNYVCLIRIY